MGGGALSLEQGRAGIPEAHAGDAAACKATETRLREEFARLKRSFTTKASDVEAHEKHLRALVTPEELERMKTLQSKDEKALLGELSSFAPNMMGRIFLYAALPSLPRNLEQLREDLREVEALRKRFAQSTPGAPKPWLEVSSPTASARPSGGSTEGVSLGRCEKVEPGRYRLDAASQATFDSGVYLSGLAMEGRLAPSFKEGVVQGFRVFGFSEDSFYGSCGFQVDGVVVKLNGVEALAMEEMTGAVSRISQARRAEVDLLRAGQPMRLTIESRPAR